MLRPVQIWDLPVRIFSALFAIALATAFVTAGMGGTGRAVHILSGYAVIGLLLFRLLWGFVGGYSARFSNMFHSFSSLKMQYLKFLNLEFPRYAGHSPIGGWAVLGIFALAATAAWTGINILIHDTPVLSHTLLGNITVLFGLTYIMTIFIVSHHTQEDIWRGRVFGYRWFYTSEGLPARATSDGLTLVMAMVAALIITTTVIGQSAVSLITPETAAEPLLAFEDSIDTLLADIVRAEDAARIAPASGQE